MKKLILILVLAGLLVLGFFYFKDTAKPIIPSQDKVKGEATGAKRAILKIGLVADSENDNLHLKKALNQIKGYGVNFVIGLGDWSSVGTEDELNAAKKIFDASGLTYFLTAGDHDLWVSRNRGEEALNNYKKVFGDSSRIIDKQSFSANKSGVQFVILDNSDIYKGISSGDWKMLEEALGAGRAKLTFVFAHKTPFHPESVHVMGEDSWEVARQAQAFLDLLQSRKVDGFFSGDLHFFAKFKSPDASVKITTIGAISADRNFQGPRFGVLTIFDDYSWDTEDVEIR